MTYTPTDLRKRAERERLISPNQRGEAAEMLEWAADRIEELEQQQNHMRDVLNDFLRSCGKWKSLDAARHVTGKGEK